MTSISVAQHDKLKAAGCVDKTYWSCKNEDEAVVAAFRRETKEHYYFYQMRRCCYCSMELQKHMLTYDAEHILDKDTYPQFMFEQGNLAVACKRCNGYKGTKRVLSSTENPLEIPTEPAAYCIVHPHLDEWEAYLEFDTIERIHAIEGNAKGEQTISICGIHNLNAARLSDSFHGNDSTKALDVLTVIADPNAPVGKKRLQLKILRGLANQRAYGPAMAVVDMLEEEFRQANGEP